MAVNASAHSVLVISSQTATLSSAFVQENNASV
jgi:hypothetical protein